MLKNKKGITLIALVITIVVLLVLVGVVINLSLGENGIIGKAKTAVDKYKNALEGENVMLGKIENIIDSNRETVTLSQLEYTELMQLKTYYYNQFDYSGTEKAIGKLEDGTIIYQTGFYFSSANKPKESNSTLLDSSFTRTNKHILDITGSMVDNYNNSVPICMTNSLTLDQVSSCYLSPSGLYLWLGDQQTTVTDIRIVIRYIKIE